MKKLVLAILLVLFSVSGAIAYTANTFQVSPSTHPTWNGDDDIITKHPLCSASPQTIIMTINGHVVTRTFIRVCRPTTVMPTHHTGKTTTSTDMTNIDTEITKHPLCPVNPTTVVFTYGTRTITRTIIPLCHPHPGPWLPPVHTITTTHEVKRTSTITCTTRTLTYITFSNGHFITILRTIKLCRPVTTTTLPPTVIMPTIPSRTWTIPRPITGVPTTITRIITITSGHSTITATITRTIPIPIKRPTHTITVPEPPIRPIQIFTQRVITRTFVYNGTTHTMTYTLFVPRVFKR